MVSIVMTSYNREKYIQYAIESILSQKYHDFELIISDDASVDNTWNIINEYSKFDNRIKIFQNGLDILNFYIPKCIHLNMFRSKTVI
jgi:glycosyltransferase involved in cell wall biosynthesis